MHSPADSRTPFPDHIERIESRTGAEQDALDRQLIAPDDGFASGTEGARAGDIDEFESSKNMKPCFKSNGLEMRTRAQRSSDQLPGLRA